MKFQYLEGIRGVAAFIVVIWHYLLVFFPAIDDGIKRSLWNIAEYQLQDKLLVLFKNTPLNIFFNGQASVRLFFVLSAIVLTYKFFKTRNYEYLSAGAIKRFFRLFGPVVFSLVITFVLAYFSIIQGSFIKDTFNISELINECFFVFAKSGSIHNPPLWTMSYEFLGSLFVFAVAALFSHYKKRWLIYFILILLLYKTLYLAFVLGIMLSDYFTSELFDKMSAKISGKIIAFLVVASILLYTLSGVRQQIWGAAIFIFCMLHSQILQNFFSSKLAVFLGKISFSMYVMHSLILSSFSYCLNMYIKMYIHSDFEAAIITLILSLPVILLVSIFTEKYIDRNSVTFSKKVYEYIKNK